MHIDYIETIVKGIVEFPEDVNLAVIVDEMGTLVTIHANASDIGRIIGRGGDTAKAIRKLAKVAGMKEGTKVSVKIVDPRK